MIKATNKFYIGHPRMVKECIDGGTGSWAQPTLAAAVDKAQKRCADTGEDQIVVQVVRIVRRQLPPVRVEVVK